MMVSFAYYELLCFDFQRDSRNQMMCMQQKLIRSKPNALEIGVRVFARDYISSSGLVSKLEK